MRSLIGRISRPAFGPINVHLLNLRQVSNIPQPLFDGVMRVTSKVHSSPASGRSANALEDKGLLASAKIAFRKTENVLL